MDQLVLCVMRVSASLQTQSAVLTIFSYQRQGSEARSSRQVVLRGKQKPEAQEGILLCIMLLFHRQELTLTAQKKFQGVVIFNAKI